MIRAARKGAVTVFPGVLLPLAGAASVQRVLNGRSAGDTLPVDRVRWAGSDGRFCLDGSRTGRDCCGRCGPDLAVLRRRLDGEEIVSEPSTGDDKQNKKHDKQRDSRARSA